MARLDYVGYINKVLRDAAAFDKPSLISVNQVRYERLETRG